MLWRLLWRSSFRLELIYRWARHQSFFSTSVSIITGLQTMAIVPVINDWPLVKKDWTWPSLLSQHNHHFLSFIIKMNNWKKVIDDWLRESERKARWWRSNQAFLRASASGWSSYWLVERTLDHMDLHLIPFSFFLFPKCLSFSPFERHSSWERKDPEKGITSGV